MRNKIKKLAQRMLFMVNGSKQWRRALATMSCVVVFATVYSLILPAITLSKDAAPKPAPMSSVEQLMLWEEPVGAIARMEERLSTPGIMPLGLDEDDPSTHYLPLGDMAGHGSGAGHITKRTITWRDPSKPNSTWTEFKAGSGQNIPANAEFRMLVEFVGVDKELLKSHGYVLDYTAESILSHFSANGVIRDEDGNVVGNISAKHDDTTNGNEVLLDFSQHQDWVNNRGSLIESEFYYQGQFDLSQLENAQDGIIELAGIKIPIPNAEDAIAEFASVELEKTASDITLDPATGRYYVQYTLTVTAGEYGCPDVKLLDTVTTQSGSGYLDGYVGVNGTPQSAAGPVSAIPLESGKAGRQVGQVYLTNTTPAQITEKAVSAPQPAANGARMAWVIGNMEAGETRTLTYRVLINPSYIGLAHPQNAISNTADLFSKSYERGTKVKSVIPNADATIRKDHANARTVGNKFIVDYTVKVTADANNSYPLSDVKIYDFANEYEGTAYAGSVKLVAGSLHLYGNDGTTELNLNDYTHYTDRNGQPATRENPRIDANNRFNVYVGDLAKGESRTITYSLELDINAALEHGNGAMGIYNRAYVYSDEVRQNSQLEAYGVQDIQSYQQWVNKAQGGQTTSGTTVTIPAGAEVYDATKSVGANGMLPTISGVSSYDIPAGSYAYTVKVNESGDFDVTSTTWNDSIQASDSAGNKYLRFLEYVRVDVYDKLVNSNDGTAVSNPPIKKSLWVKIDDLSEFSFTGKQIGLDGSDSYVLTYYAKAILPEGVSSYGTINANNKFAMSGQIGLGNGVFINPNIYQSVTVTAKEPGVNNPFKSAWYYDAQDTTFAQYHNGKSNGALYWIIKVSGDKIPNLMQFQESTRIGQYNNYLRKDSSLLGFYIINFPEGTDTATSVDEFLARYSTYADFEADLNSADSNIHQVPQELGGRRVYTSEWSGYTDKTFGDNGQHFDFTIQFKQDYNIPAGTALYLLIKTDPVVLPGNGGTITYQNKCNYRTEAMGNISRWPDTSASQVIRGPEGSLQKSVSQIRDTYTNSNGTNVSKGSGVYRVSGNGTKFEFFDLSARKFNDYTETNDYKENTSRRTFQTDGNFLKTVDDSGNRTPYVYEDGTYLTWKLSINRNGTMGGHEGFWIEDVLPEGVDLAYVRTLYANVGLGYPGGTGNWVKNGTAGGPENIIANESSTWETAGWTRHRVQNSPTGSQGNYSWARYGTVYYTDGNRIRLYIPQVIGTASNGNDRVEFQIVCRLNDTGKSELAFGDAFLNNQATLYDQYGTKIESSGAEIRVAGGNVGKELLLNGKFNHEDASKLNSTTYPYRLEINPDKVDMAKDSDIITIPLVDRMTGNLTLDLSSLRIYALPDGKEKEDTSPAGDNDLIYYGGSYTKAPAAAGHIWYTTDENKVGRPLGYLGTGTPIKISIRDAENANGQPAIGADGSVMQDVVFENLPDNTRLIISYSVSVKLKDGHQLIFENKAFWDGHEFNIGGETDTVNREYQADATATSSDHGAVHVVKYDKNNYNTRLAGAEFALYRAEYKEATAGKAFEKAADGSYKELTQAEIEARHWIAVYEGNDYTVTSHDNEIPTLRDSTGKLLMVKLYDSLGYNWMTPEEASNNGYELHHKYETTTDGQLTLCKQGPLAYGETDENGNLSYGFGFDEDFGRRFIPDGEGGKIYLDDPDYREAHKDDEVYHNDRIYFNKVYAVKEIKAPEGYLVDERPYFFVVANPKYDGVDQNYFYHEIWPDDVHICTRTENGEITFMHNAANIKQPLSISKDFAGSVEAARPGTYSFGIWHTPLTTSTKEGMLASASITYTDDDFGTYTDDSGMEVYGLLPDHVKSVEFPATLNYGTYYIYELTASGSPILNAGVVNGYAYLPSFGGESAVEGHKIIFNDNHTHVTVTNRGYSIDVEKRFTDLGGNELEQGLMGEYRFGIWRQNQLGDDGLPHVPALDIKELTWLPGDLDASKRATFIGLWSDTTYCIFELDKNGLPIGNTKQVIINGNQFVVSYDKDSVSPSSGVSTVVTVTNSASVTLPHTGGMGDHLFTYGGFGMMCLACLGYTFCLMLRRRGKEENS